MKVGKIDENRQAKSKNRNQIFRIVYKNHRVSKQNIMTECGLSLPTISQNLRELMEMGLVQEGGTFESTGGRKAKIIQCVANARVAIGMDITAGHMCMVLVNLDVQVLDSLRIRLDFSDTKEYYERVAHELDAFIEKNEISRRQLLGVGLSLPAILDDRHKIIMYAKVIPAPRDIYERLRPYLSYPFLMYNDANSAGLAEYWSRPNKDRTLVYLSLNNSVGGALVHGGTTYFGENRRGAEFGHMTIVPDGRTCYCGQKGCVDAYCSAHRLSDHTDGQLDVFFREMREEGKHKEVFQEYLEYLARSIHNLRMAFDCDVVLGGYVGPYLQDYLPEVQRLVAQYDPFEKDGSYVTICGYRTEASAVGAALHYIDHFIQTI